MNNITEIAKKRYTAKHYNPNKHVSKEQLEQLLTVLRNAPSSVNSQPWHFYIVNNQTSADKILPAVTEFNHDRITQSSYTVVFCIKEELNKDYLDHLLNKEEQDGRFPSPDIKEAQNKGRNHFVQLNSSTIDNLHKWESNQLYIALGQFLFAAAAIGIDSTAIEGFDSKKMDEILSLKEKGLRSVVLASIGYRDQNDSNAMRPKSRLEKEEIFTFI